MKRRDGRKLVWAEGGLIAVSLIAVVALSLGIWWNRRPRAELVTPVHAVLEAELRRASLIDLNSASAEALAELPGIGGGLAARIVAWREENGPFESVDALRAVEGVGEKRIKAIRARVRVE